MHRPTFPARLRRPVHRQILAGLVVLVGLAGWSAAGATPARADTSSTLTVVGTSDVSDSGLIPNLIQPAFEKAYPQYTFKYIGTATGTAISDAESGSVGASALIVHAASLENQFVAGGYSQERYGRAIFTNDFVLAGPKGDPAGVAANGAHDVAQAFADVATAGVAGKATFVSRGGTPGTTVEEHKLWALVDSSHLAPPGLLLCTVNDKQGGGETPIAPGNGVTANGQPCPNGGAEPSGNELPAWYVVTGLTQGPNVIAANACNGYRSGPNSCYVLTDRGTYDYLASGTDPAGSIPNLTIVTRDDSASAPGGADELINYFHAYAINPAKPGETVNVPAAVAFLNFLTSPVIQQAVGAYLAHTPDPEGAPFKPDASPIIQVGGRWLPRRYRAARPATISGTVVNAEPGYPAPAGQTVSLAQVIGGIAVPVPGAQARTSATGSFRLRATIPATGQYTLVTGQIAQVEDTTLSPVYGDILSPAASAPVATTVAGAVTSLNVFSAAGRTLVLGTVAPGFDHARGVVTISGRPGSRGRFRRLAVDRVGSGDANFVVSLPLRPGAWQLRASFADGRRVLGATSRSVRVTVAPAPAARVSLVSLSAGPGSVTARVQVTGAATGLRIALMSVRAAAGPARLGTIAHRTVGRAGTFTLRARLRRGTRYLVVLRGSRAGQAPAVSGVRAVATR